MNRQDTTTDFFFVEDIAYISDPAAQAYIVHIFIIEGTLHFKMNGRELTSDSNVYTIIISPMMLEEIYTKGNFRAFILCLPNNHTSFQYADSSLNLKSMPFLMLNPTLPLTSEDRHICLEGLTLLRQRMQLTEHRLYHSMLASLLGMHIFDLHNIIVRQIESQHISHRALQLMSDFISLLHRGDYREHRTLHYYASQLHIADNYLAEISRKITHHSPSYWIDLFTSADIMRLLKEKKATLTEIADQLHFSSMSYFTRYVVRTLGAPPTTIQRQY